MFFFIKKCSDCGPLPQSHVLKYLESSLENILPSFHPKISLSAERALLTAFCKMRIIKKESYKKNPRIPFRSSVFIEEAIKRGLKFKILKGPMGHTGWFEMEKESKTYFFEGIPRMELLNESNCIDDKMRVKNVLEKLGAPTIPGKCFNLFQAKKALEYGLSLGFPLVAKPRSGSISRHVFLDIKDVKTLKGVIKRVFNYEPFVVIEKFMPNIKTYRATVVDFSKIAVVERIPAHIVGDGSNDITKLIKIKIAVPAEAFLEKKTPLFLK